MKLIDTNLAQRMNTLWGNAYFTDMPEPLLKEVALNMQLREYQRGEILFWEADPCDGIHVLENGSAKIYRLSLQRRQYIVRILQEGDTFVSTSQTKMSRSSGCTPIKSKADVLNVRFILC